MVLRLFNLIVPKSILASRKARKDKAIISAWEAEGRPLPPPHLLKQQTVESYQKQHKIEILVETGTYLGDMVAAEISNFRKIYSIELSEELWKAAKEKFKHFASVKLLQGDSGSVLHKIVPDLKERAIFWLDGHYSGGITAKGAKECPILEELRAILISEFAHILLIDDARCFDGKGDYPTIDELKTYISQKRKIASFLVEDDIIRVELG